MLVNYIKTFKENTVYKKTRAVFSSIFHFIHKKFLWGIFKRINEKFFKFLFVGFLNTVFAYFIYAFFVSIGLTANLALFLQYIIGVLWNFKTTGSIVFKSHDNKLLFKFILSYVFTFLLNSFLLTFLNRFLNSYLSQGVLILPIAFISFIIFKKFVFKN